MVWPESAARTLALELAKGAPLRPLFNLRQRRRRADVTQGSRRVAELSLDAVRVTVGRQPVSYFEVEVELKGDGSEADLAALAAELAGAWARGRAARQVRAGARTGRRSYGRCRAAARAGRAPRWKSAPAGADLLARRAQVVLSRASGLPRARSRCAPAFLSVGSASGSANFARNGSAFFTARRAKLPAVRRTNPAPAPRLHSRTSPL